MSQCTVSVRVVSITVVSAKAVSVRIASNCRDTIEVLLGHNLEYGGSMSSLPTLVLECPKERGAC